MELAHPTAAPTDAPASARVSSSVFVDAEPPGRALTCFVVAGLSAGMVGRLTVAWDHPLWLDETVTGAIALQPSLAGLVRDCLNELGGPVYYALIWGWAKIAGTSDFALRLPSAIFSILAPLILLRARHIDPQTRWVWAALAALSLPAFHYASDARSYSLLFLLACCQALAFIRLIGAPTLRRAAAWAALSALLILTHYHSFPLAAAQGFLFLLIHRAAALRTWPAALAFVPVAVWLPLHLPVMLRFSTVAWQDRLSVPELLTIPEDLLGLGSVSFGLALLIAGSSALKLGGATAADGANRGRRGELAAVASGLLGVLAVCAIALTTHSYHERYLIPYVPVILLGLAMWARGPGRLRPPAPVLLIALFMVFFGLGAAERLDRDHADVRRHLFWGDIAADFAARNADRMVFFWDHPTASTSEEDLFSRTAGFFFERAGQPVKIIPLILGGAGPVVDPNAAIPQALAPLGAQRAGKGSFIWLYWPDAPSLARRFPPQLEEWRGSFDCRNYRVGTDIVLLGCIER